MKQLAILIILTLPLIGNAQTPQDDQITFDAAMEWLDRKLNYIYYDRDAQKWWLNKFYVNAEKEVTIKNIFTDKPRSANIKEKVYLIRTFQIQDINPYTIEIRDVASNQGRIQRGTMLELRTFGHDNKIHKTIDGRTASNISFVQLSFPTFMTDSIADYPQLVKAKLTEAIISSTTAYQSSSLEETKKNIFKILDGNFFTDNNQKVQLKKRFPNVVDIAGTKETEFFFGWDTVTGKFFKTEISADGIVTGYYELTEGNKLLLQNINQKDDWIELDTYHSFTMNGKKYYRE